MVIANKYDLSKTMVDRKQNRTWIQWLPDLVSTSLVLLSNTSSYTLQVHQDDSPLWLWRTCHNSSNCVLFLSPQSLFPFLSFPLFLYTYLLFFSHFIFSFPFVFPFFCLRRGIIQGRNHCNSFEVRVKVHISEFLVMKIKTVYRGCRCFLLELPALPRPWFYSVLLGEPSLLHPAAHHSRRWTCGDSPCPYSIWLVQRLP